MENLKFKWKNLIEIRSIKSNFLRVQLESWSDVAYPGRQINKACPWLFTQVEKLGTVISFFKFNKINKETTFTKRLIKSKNKYLLIHGSIMISQFWPVYPALHIQPAILSHVTAFKQLHVCEQLRP